MIWVVLTAIGLAAAGIVAAVTADRRTTEVLVRRNRPYLENIGFDVMDDVVEVATLNLDCLSIMEEYSTTRAHPYARRQRGTSTEHVLRILGKGFHPYDRCWIYVRHVQQRRGRYVFWLVRSHRRRISRNLLALHDEQPTSLESVADPAAWPAYNSRIREVWVRSKHILEVHVGHEHLVVVGGAQDFSPSVESFITDAQQIAAHLDRQ